MSTEVTKPTLAEETPASAEEAKGTTSSEGLGEGLAVFRALLLMVLSYVVFGFLGWIAWHAFRQWRGH